MDLDVDFDFIEGSEIPVDLLIDSSTAKTQLSERSENKYNETYTYFRQWKENKKHDKITEFVMLEYFQELAEKYKPSTMWATFSMLKTKILENDNVMIGNYENLLKFLRLKSAGFKSKESSYMSPDVIKEFMTKAPDSLFLATKVALIFGVCGGCNTHELTQVTMDDIKDYNGLYRVTIRRTGRNPTGTFTIEDDFYNTVKKYINKRPKNVFTNRLFLNYQNGKCTAQVIGQHKFAKMPKEIARFCELPDPDSYTVQSFRKTSNWLAGASLSKRKALNPFVLTPGIPNSDQENEDYVPKHKKTNDFEEPSTSTDGLVIVKQELIEEEEEDKNFDDDSSNSSDKEVDLKLHTVMLKESHKEEEQTDVFSLLYNENLNSFLPNRRWGVHFQDPIGDRMSAIVFSIIDYISNDLRLAPVYYKQLILYENLNAQIYFYNILRSELSTSISSVKELRKLIEKVDETKLCRGGPSVLLYEDVVTNIARKEEASNKWRHKSCLVVLEKGVCCKMCFSLHETLRKLSNHSS